MTFNWGHKLILVFIVFGGLMSFLVYRSVKTNFELVSKEYYKDEIEYQQVIDGTRQAGLLNSNLGIVQENDSILIRFPREMYGGVVTGKAWFYYAPDARRDRRLPFECNGATGQKIPGADFLPGRYLAKVWWEFEGRQYYSEQTVKIQ